MIVGETPRQRRRVATCRHVRTAISYVVLRFHLVLYGVGGYGRSTGGNLDMWKRMEHLIVLELWGSGRPWRSKGRLVEFFTVSAVIQWSSPTVATTRTTETIHKTPTPRRPVNAAVYNFEPGQLILPPDAFDTRGPQTLWCSQWVTSTIRQFDPAVYD